MTKDDSNQPFWKEKFINGLPQYFAHKIRSVLSNQNNFIDYDSLTYGDIVATIKNEGLKMCIYLKISREMKDEKRR